MSRYWAATAGLANSLLATPQKTTIPRSTATGSRKNTDDALTNPNAEPSDEGFVLSVECRHRAKGGSTRVMKDGFEVAAVPPRPRGGQKERERPPRPRRSWPASVRRRGRPLAPDQLDERDQPRRGTVERGRRLGEHREARRRHDVRPEHRTAPSGCASHDEHEPRHGQRLRGFGQVLGRQSDEDGGGADDQRACRSHRNAPAGQVEEGAEDQHQRGQVTCPDRQQQSRIDGAHRRAQRDEELADPRHGRRLRRRRARQRGRPVRADRREASRTASPCAPRTRPDPTATRHGPAPPRSGWGKGSPPATTIPSAASRARTRW